MRHPSGDIGDHPESRVQLIAAGDGPVELRHLPRSSGRGMGVGSTDLDRLGHQGVDLLMIGVAVATLRVVADDDLRPEFAHDRHERPESLLPVMLTNARGLRAAGVPAIPSIRQAVGTTEWRVAAQRRECAMQFQNSVATELIGSVDHEIGPRIADHLTLFTERARQHGDVDARAHVMGDGPAGGDALVVRVRMDQQQPLRLRHRLFCHNLLCHNLFRHASSLATRCVIVCFGLWVGQPFIARRAFAPHPVTTALSHRQA